MLKHRVKLFVRVAPIRYNKKKPKPHSMETPWNTPCGKPWFGPCCTMVHAAETSSHLLHTTGCIHPRAYVPWCTPWRMNFMAIVAFFPWFNSRFTFGRIWHGNSWPFTQLVRWEAHDISSVKNMHGTKPPMDDRWVALRLNQDVCHACVVGHPHARFSGIH